MMNTITMMTTSQNAQDKIDDRVFFQEETRVSYIIICNYNNILAFNHITNYSQWNIHWSRIWTWDLRISTPTLNQLNWANVSDEEEEECWFS